MFAAADELACPAVAAVLIKGALAGAGRHGRELPVIAAQGGQNLAGAVYQHDLLRAEEFVQSFPPVGKNGSTAGGRFEKTSRGTVAGARHALAGDVQRGPGGGIQGGMLGRGYMVEARHVGRPAPVARIKGAGEHKALLWQLPCRP